MTPSADFSIGDAQGPSGLQLPSTLPMPTSRPFRVFLVQTPCLSPSAPSWMALHLAAVFSASGFRLFFYDANLDFFDRLGRSDPLGVSDIAKCGGDPFPAVIPENGKALCTPTFYRPEAFVDTIHSLRRQAEFCREAPGTATDFQDRLAHRIETAKPKLLIFMAQIPRQLASGLQMLRFARSSQKGLPAFLICGPRVQAPAGPDSDAIISLDALASLSDRVSELDKLPLKITRGLPDLHRFPLARYSAPETVLDLRGFSGIPNLKPILNDLYRWSVKGALLFEADSSLFSRELFLPSPDTGSSLGFGLRLRLDEKIPPSFFPESALAGVKLILWSRSPALQKEIGKTLYPAAAAGIWNHLEVQGREAPPHALLDFIAANPNLAHSWGGPFPEDLAVGAAPLRDLPNAYDRIAPLPGTPFWHFLSDPVHLLLYLIKHGAKKVLRWRVRNDGSVFTLGDGISTQFVKPDALPPGHLDTICRMVEAGGSVDTRWVRFNLERAFLVGYAEEEGVLVGNSSLKNPREEYLKSLSERTGFDLAGYLERGYTSVRPEYRGLGIGTKLLEGLTARIGNRKLFSIIGEDNLATQKMALRNRTRKVGTFFSQKSGKTVGISGTRRNARRMNIGIITVRGPDYPPNFRLCEAAQEQGHRATLIHPYRTWPFLGKGSFGIIPDDTEMPDIVLPRQGATLGDACLSLIRHFGLMGIPVVNGMDAIRKTKDKFLSLQALQAESLPVPDTLLVNAAEGLPFAVSRLGGFPVVVKPVSSRQGTGVELVKDRDQLMATGERLDRRTGLLVQRFIPPEGRRDVRVITLGNQAAGAAEFSPNPGDFRGNFHLSGKSRPVAPEPGILNLALRAAKALDLEISGVDILLDKKQGPLVVEVNYSPGFRGLEAATGLDIAGAMVRYLWTRFQTSEKGKG